MVRILMYKNQFSFCFLIMAVVFSAYSDSTSIAQNMNIDSNSLYSNRIIYDTKIDCNCKNEFNSTLLKATMGLGIGTVSTFLGIAIGGRERQNKSGTISEDWNNYLGETFGSISLGIIGYTLCIPSGVYLGGKVMKENGSYIGSLVGNICGIGAGFIASLGTVSIVNKISGNNNYSMGTLLGTISICSISGSIVGYNISRHCKK
jgi:hypothetical protein